MIANIQFLRFFSALLIVLHHSIGTGSAYGYSPAVSNHLSEITKIGVDIFFIISGIVVTLSFLEKKETASLFIFRRVAKVVPLYWFVTTLLLVILIVLPQDVVNSSVALPNEIITSYLFLSQISGNGYPIFFVGWTLEFEMLFYCAFAIFIFLSNKISAMPKVLIIFTVFLAFAVSHLIFYFAVGVAMAYEYHFNANKRINVRCIFSFTGIIIISLALSFSEGVLRFDSFLFKLAAISSCFAALYFVQIKCKVILLLGSITYSTYLVQVFVISAFYKLIKYSDTRFSADLLLIPCIVLVLIAAFLLHYFVEKPIDVYFKNIFIRVKKL
jgi:peptidoglycan/LPS O-acetylase OafA/YrhL